MSTEKEQGSGQSDSEPPPSVREKQESVGNSVERASLEEEHDSFAPPGMACHAPVGGGRDRNRDVKTAEAAGDDSSPRDESDSADDGNSPPAAADAPKALTLEHQESMEHLRTILEKLHGATGAGGVKFDVDALLGSSDSVESKLQVVENLLRDMEAGDSSEVGRPISYSMSHNPVSQGMFGEYRLIRHIKSGGFGKVYLARQCSVGRNVALKILPSLAIPGLREIQRFVREAKTAGAVEHPAIVAVLDAGVLARRPYIAMRYIDGESLDGKIRKARASRRPGSFAYIFRLAPSGNSHLVPRERTGRPLETGSGPAIARDILRVAAFFEKAARGLHEAHKAGLVHRDIKPGNIMVTSDGQPVILDFGLAQEATEDKSITQTGELAGTPPYMSPEQISSRIKLDARTDVYSLAVTLYECLALERPFKAESRDALYQEILAKPPPSIRAVNPHIPRDLRVVIETALQKDRDLRYASALDFADDLRRVRKHRAIHAQAPSVPRKVWQTARLLPVHAWVVAALLLMLLSLQAFMAVKLWGEPGFFFPEAEKQVQEEAEEASQLREEGGPLEQTGSEPPPVGMGESAHDVQKLPPDTSRA